MEGGEPTPRRVCAGKGGELLLHPAPTSPTLHMWLAKASWLCAQERKSCSPSDRLHSQVTTEVIFPFTHLLGAVGQEMPGGFASSTLLSLARYGPARGSWLRVAAGAGCYRRRSWGQLPRAGVLPSSVLHVYWWLWEGQAELESCHCSLPSQAGSHSALSQGRGEQRARGASSSCFEKGWGGGSHPEQACSITPRGWGWACLRKLGLGSPKRCKSVPV